MNSFGGSHGTDGKVETRVDDSTDWRVPTYGGFQCRKKNARPCIAFFFFDNFHPRSFVPGEGGEEWEMPSRQPCPEGREMHEDIKDVMNQALAGNIGPLPPPGAKHSAPEEST